jgi:hypothetical protein
MGVALSNQTSQQSTVNSQQKETNFLFHLWSVVYGLWTSQNSRYSYFLRITSFATTLIFTFTTLAWSAPEDVFKIRIPEEMGHVKERWAAGTNSKFKISAIKTSADPSEQFGGQNSKLNEITKPVVIHIQDAHTSLEAQKNIAKLLLHLEKNEKISAL